MAKYKRKAQIVEAAVFRPDVQPWPDGVVEAPGGRRVGTFRMAPWIVVTPDGAKPISPGEYVISTKSGEHYPISRADLDKFYDLISNPAEG